MSKANIRQLIGCVIIAGMLAALAMGIVFLMQEIGLAEEDGTRWVLCNPDSFVNVRAYPRKNGGYLGRLEVGDQVTTDGQEKNGFIHIIGFGESGEGWVSKAYLVEDPPVVKTEKAWIYGSGRVAVRKYPGGPRVKWMKPGDELILYAYSEEWAITNKGFIKTRYLEA